MITVRCSPSSVFVTRMIWVNQKLLDAGGEMAFWQYDGRVDYGRVEAVDVRVLLYEAERPKLENEYGGCLITNRDDLRKRVYLDFCHNEESVATIEVQDVWRDGKWWIGEGAM